MVALLSKSTIMQFVKHSIEIGDIKKNKMK